ncbi:MAG: hypothetical protein P8Z30_20850 [Acidobacteriota bacterium]
MGGAYIVVFAMCAVDGIGTHGSWSMACSYRPTGWVTHRMTLNNGTHGSWSMACSYRPTGWVTHRMTLNKIPSASG